MTAGTIRPQVAKVTTPARQALCCECGNLRTVKAGAARRNHVSMGESPERIAELMHFAPDYWSRVSAYHHLLEDLKCTPCGKVTQHADVRPTGSRDWAEEDRPERLNLSVEDQLDLLRSLGARIYEVTERPRLIAGVSQYLDDDTFHVDVNPAADPARLTLHLAKIVDRVVMPSDKEWFVSKDEDGAVYASVEWVMP